MFPIIPALTISILLLVFYILLTFWYRSYLEKIQTTKKQKTMKVQFDRYDYREKKNEMKEKLKQISKIIQETEETLEQEIHAKDKKVSIKESVPDDESLIIEQAEKEYLIHSADFGSAMPKTETELHEDMENLKMSIQILESLDKEFYTSEPIKPDLGTGMFYEKITRKLQEIIKEQQLLEFKIIPVQRLKYHALNRIKNLKNDDFLPVLKLMKDTKLIADLVEINPKLYIIIFGDTEFEFSNPEKVVLSFVYEKEGLTVEDLLEITEWDFGYASQVLNSLFSKELAMIKEDIIMVEGFGSSEERRNWNITIDKFNEQQQIKFEEREKKKKALKQRLEQKMKDAEESYRLNRVRSKSESQENYIIENEEKLKQNAEEVPQIKFKSKPKVKKITDLKKIRDLYEKEPDKLSEIDLKELISQNVLSYHEKYSLLNGGLVQHAKLSRFIHEDIENAPEELIQETITKLLNLKMIYEVFEIHNQKFYLFKDLQLKKSEKEFISFALDKKPMSKVKFIEGLNWDEEKVLKVMKSLQSKGVLRIEQNNIIIPGIIQRI
ncbi:MAG: hypothetical protein ACFFD1_09565 [Candidatus Thorarchaeota archaeon]